MAPSCRLGIRRANGQLPPMLARTCATAELARACARPERALCWQCPQTCSDLGQWQSGDACYVCNGAGSCTGVCSPGSVQCNGNIPQSCDSTGKWVSQAACADSVCQAGACTGVCRREPKCVGDVPQTCNASGQWGSEAACPFVCSSSTGTCAGSCVPGAASAAATSLKAATRREFGSAQLLVRWHAVRVPAPMVARPRGQHNARRQRRADVQFAGKWISSANACPYVCDTSTGTCGGVCTPGSKQCSSNTQQTCESNGQWQSASAACPYVCTDGSCTGECVRIARSVRAPTA